MTGDGSIQTADASSGAKKSAATVRILRGVTTGAWSCVKTQLVVGHNIYAVPASRNHVKRGGKCPGAFKSRAAA